MHSPNNGMGHRDHGLSANVISQPFEFPAVKPHAITLGQLDSPCTRRETWGRQGTSAPDCASTLPGDKPTICQIVRPRKWHS